MNLSTASATNNGSLYRGWSGKAVGSGDISGGIMPQSRPLAAASAALVCGSVASASGVVVQIAGHEGDGKSVIASVPLTISTTLSTIVSPPSPAGNAPSTIASSPSPATSAPDNPQVSASPANLPRSAPLNAATTAANSPHTTPLNAVTTAATASTGPATTDLAQEPVPAAKKSQKAARSPNERNRSGHDAAAWGRYAHQRQTSSW